jgi:hypothetical protein
MGGLGVLVSTPCFALSDSTATTSVVAATDSQANINFSPGVRDVLKMLDAKVDPGVIRAYINNSPIPFNPSAAEIIALKQRGVPDDIITALMQRGAEVRAQMAQAATQSAVQTPNAPPAGYPYDYSAASSYAYPYDYAGYPYAYPNYGYPYNYWGYNSYYPWSYYSPFFFNFCLHRPFCDFDRFHRFDEFRGNRGFAFRGSGPWGATVGVGSRPFAGHAGFAGRSFAGPRAGGFAVRSGGFAARSGGFAVRSGGFAGHSGGFAGHGGGGGFGGHGGGHR